MQNGSKLPSYALKRPLEMKPDISFVSYSLIFYKKVNTTVRKEMNLHFSKFREFSESQDREEKHARLSLRDKRKH